MTNISQWLSALIKNMLLLPLVALLLGACVRTDVPAQCPDMFSVSLYVQDKNYTEASSSIDESLPFANYISGVYYTWRNLDTDEVISSNGYLPVTGNAAEYTIPLTGVPAGRYQLTAWGNLPGMEAIEGEETELHASGEESTDIYLGSQTIDLTGVGQAYRLAMRRTKGLMEVECIGFPASITRVELGFGPVYGLVDGQGDYAGSATVTKSFPFGSASSATLKTLLAPTLAATTSNLTVSLYQADQTEPAFVFPANDLTVLRNQITYVKVTFDAPTNTWEIWVMIDGTWIKVYNMTISLN